MISFFTHRETSTDSQNNEILYCSKKKIRFDSTINQKWDECRQDAICMDVL